MFRIIGYLILSISALAAAYAALAFFVINALPPNSSTGGRLPSLYLLFGALGGMLLGVTLRGRRSSKARS